MVNILLSNGWRIRSDRYQFILSKEKGNRQNNQYFRTLEEAFEEVLRQNLRDSDAVSLNALIEEQKTFVDSLNAVLSPLNYKVVGTK